MDQAFVEGLQERVNKVVDAGNELVGFAKRGVVANDATPDKVEAPARKLPEGKRVVRTKTSGDRVYLLDDNKKTRQWLTNPEVLKATGFGLEDVVEIDDTKFHKYTMAQPIYKVETPNEATNQ